MIVQKKDKYMIVIPARIDSTRFPKKVLADVGGYPMVIATANRVKDVDKVLIATDSTEVIEVAQEYGYGAVLTDKDHKSGTDRVYEAVESSNLDDSDIVINVQADEPFIEREVVQNLYDRTRELKDQAIMVSCYKTITKDDAKDPNLVKVILDINSNAIYFSRSKIPYNRAECKNYYGHLGLYGFTKRSLKEFCNLRESNLEEIEKLEQLRAIYHNKTIAMIEVNSQSFGIDTIDDLNKALGR
jgi:3-deoxy-manno-octulosonate cytidylyltransferase (CMP-KDO synthetase)